MFFYLSKIVWLFLEPGNVLFLLLFIGVALLWTRWARWGKRFCAAALLFFVICGLLPVGFFSVSVLENRFPAINDYPEKIDGIIVLGGIINLEITEDRGQHSFGSNIERVTILHDLTRRYPDADVVFTSGAGLINRPDLKEASIVEPFLRTLVKNPDKLIFENESRNTYENVKFSKTLLQPTSDQKWLLVTSATHIPRAVGIFRQFDWKVIPHPVDYLTGTTVHYNVMTNPRAGLSYTATGLHEWLGLLAYYLTSKSAELFPSP